MNNAFKHAVQVIYEQSKLSLIIDEAMEHSKPLTVFDVNLIHGSGNTVYLGFYFNLLKANYI